MTRPRVQRNPTARLLLAAYLWSTRRFVRTPGGGEVRAWLRRLSARYADRAGAYEDLCELAHRRGGFLSRRHSVRPAAAGEVEIKRAWGWREDVAGRRVA